MIAQALADNIVRKQLAGMIADAECLLRVAAWRDLPAGVKIITCAGDVVSGFSIGSGHRFAEAHGCRPGAVAVAVAAEDRLRAMLELYPDDLPAALGEGRCAIETVATHELAHALVGDDVADAVADVDPAIMRMLPARVARRSDKPFLQTARDHDASWLAALVILFDRCRRYRPWARDRWAERLIDNITGYGAPDHRAVADAVGDVADDAPLRDLLSPEGDIVRRVVAAIPAEAERARLIAQARGEAAAERLADELIDTVLASRGHVATGPAEPSP